MKINPSRKSTESIMANQKFGGITLRKGNVSMYVPPENITQEGKIKRFAIKEFNAKVAESNKRVG